VAQPQVHKPCIAPVEVYTGVAGTMQIYGLYWSTPPRCARIEALRLPIVVSGVHVACSTSACRKAWRMYQLVLDVMACAPSDRHTTVYTLQSSC